MSVMQEYYEIKHHFVTEFTYVKFTKKQNNSLIPRMGYVTLSSKTTIVKHVQKMKKIHHLQQKTLKIY